MGAPAFPSKIKSCCSVSQKKLTRSVSPTSRRSLLGIASIGMLFWRRRRGRILLNQTQRLSDAALKLWIKATRVILWSVGHINRRVGAIILPAPAPILEPETKLWLGRDGPIGQRHIWGDANDAAPGALADQRP